MADPQSGHMSDWTFPAEESGIDVGRIDADGVGAFVGIIINDDAGNEHKIALEARDAIMLCRTATHVALEILGKIPPAGDTSGPVMQ